MMDVLDNLCHKLVDDIAELNKKADISPSELDRVGKAVDIVKDIKTIEAMEKGDYTSHEEHVISQK